MKFKSFWPRALIFLRTISTACSVKGREFEASVLEIEEQFLRAEPLEGEEERASSDQITIPKSEWEDLELEEGDIIRITYNGEILETYPARLGEIDSVELLEKSSESR